MPIQNVGINKVIACFYVTSCSTDTVLFSVFILVLYDSKTYWKTAMSHYPTFPYKLHPTLVICSDSPRCIHSLCVAFTVNISAAWWSLHIDFPVHNNCWHNTIAVVSEGKLTTKTPWKNWWTISFPPTELLCISTGCSSASCTHYRSHLKIKKSNK